MLLYIHLAFQFNSKTLFTTYPPWSHPIHKTPGNPEVSFDITFLRFINFHIDLTKRLFVFCVFFIDHMYNMNQF